MAYWFIREANENLVRNKLSSLGARERGVRMRFCCVINYPRKSVAYENQLRIPSTPSHAESQRAQRFTFAEVFPWTEIR